MSIIRGVALYQGKVYLGTVDGRLIALDAGSGKEVWSAQTTPRDSMYLITGAPRVAHGKVFIGNGGADFGTRGFVSAYDAADGKLLWRFYTVPNGRVRARWRRLGRGAEHRWSADLAREWYTAGGGGHVWNSLVYDPDFNQVYLATGNGFPWNTHLRTAASGDNLFIASIVAVDADTGAYKWHYQESPGEGWDSRFGCRHGAGRSGDRRTNAQGAGASTQERVHVCHRSANRQVALRRSVRAWHQLGHACGSADRSAASRRRGALQAQARDVSPGEGGGHYWNPIAFSPQTGLLYLQAKPMRPRATSRARNSST